MSRSQGLGIMIMRNPISSHCTKELKYQIILSKAIKIALMTQFKKLMKNLRKVLIPVATR